MNHGHRFLLGSMVVGLLAAALALLAAGEPPLLAAEAERPLGQKTAAPNMAEPRPMSAEIKNKAWDAEAAATLEDIPNGDFELGHIYWQELSSNDWPLIYYQEDAIVDAHGGEWLAWLGGWSLETSLIQQEVTIPADRPVLDYWHWILSEHECGYDVARVRLNGTAVDQYDLCDTVNTGGWVQHTVSLAAYAGQTVMLGIEVQTTASTFSSLILDDLTLMPVSVIYVDADADPDGDGKSWESAYTDLQLALADAEAGEQIWVAAGTYKPSEPFIPEDPRSVAFQMQNEVAIYGGFDPSAGATEWADRNWETYVTILSGDIGIEGDPADNSYHVFYHPGGLDSTAILDGFTITGGNANHATDTALRVGGGMLNVVSSPALINCTFSSNSAGYRGGGIYNDTSSPVLINCLLESNSAVERGGGMYNHQSPAKIANCTFDGNGARAGGGMSNFSASPTLTDCAFTGNSAIEGGGAMDNYSSSPTMTNGTFFGNSAGIYGGAMVNYSSSPTMTNCTFYGNSAGDGGAIYNRNSAPVLTNCILWGDTPNELLNYDEASAPAVTYSDVQGGYAGEGNIDAAPLFADAANGDFHLLSGSPCVDAGSNAASVVPYDFEGHHRIRDGDGDGVVTVDMGVDEKRVLYVDGSAAAGTGSGTSWDDAFADLQAPLDVAASGDAIWVAAGLYRPTADHGGTGDRYRSFQLMNGVAIYGGFDPSIGDNMWEERDWDANVTILSGDVGTEGDASDNSYHVFYHPEGIDLDGTAILDGFTITGGNADGESSHANGGGMYNDSSSPSLLNCTFHSNSSSGSGAGMHNTGSSSPTLTGCAFEGNTAGTEGGGMHNDGSSPTLTGCTFSENTADAGGGIYNGSDSLPELTNCTFVGNSANSGGGMHNDGSSPVVVNCTFQGNSAVGNGGGMRNTRDSLPILTNCTFEGNRATNGGAIHNYLSSPPTVTNCILWGDSKPEIVNLESSAVVTYSDVQGGYTGEGNIDEDPLFLDPDNGDLSLRPGSPCIDSGTATAPNLPLFDFQGDPRILDGDRDGELVVDMGVDEALWHPVYLPLVLKGY